MPTTMKRIHLSLTKEDLRQLETLGSYFEETNSQVIKRALILLHYITFTNRDKNE